MHLFNQVFAAVLFFFFSSAKPDDHKAVETKAKILTAKTWIVQEAVDMQDNSFNRYKRGANNNTNNLDGDELTFALDHSGTYKDATDAVYKLVWRFTNEDETAMDVKIQYPEAVILHYEMMHLLENDFSATHTYINGSGAKVLASFHRIYKKDNCDNEKKGPFVKP